MGSLNDIVTVNVSTLTAAVKQAGFGIPLIADYHIKWSERVRFYSSLQGMLDDGFTVNDGGYKAVAAVFAQNPQVPLVAVGRRALAPDQTVTLTPSAVNSTVYTVDCIDPAGLAQTATFTSDANATVAEICTGLASAITGLTGSLVATDNTTNITVKAASAGLWFSVTAGNRTLLAVGQTHADPGIATDLAAIATENNDWYGCTLSTMGKAENVAAATWIEANKKLAFLSTQDYDCVGGGSSDVGSTIKTATQFRTAVCYNAAGYHHVGAALFGQLFPNNPGSVTAKFKRLAGEPSSTLTATELVNLRAKNIGFYTDFGGVSIFAEGKTAAGEWIDVIRDRDWFESRLQTRVYSLLVNNKKVPFTDAGIASVEAELRAQLREAIDAGFLANTPAPVVNVPTAASISSTDKNNRVLKTLTFSATLAGAIHSTTLSGSITV